MQGDRETEAARLIDIEAQLTALAELERAGDPADVEALERRVDEVSGLFEEAKRLARDAHTAVFARIAVQAGFLLGRLDIRLRSARREQPGG